LSIDFTTVDIDAYIKAIEEIGSLAQKFNNDKVRDIALARWKAAKEFKEKSQLPWEKDDKKTIH